MSGTNTDETKKTVGSKTFNSSKLSSLARESGDLFSAPRQTAVPNYALQALLCDIRMTYLEQLGQLALGNLSEEQIEQIRLYTA